MKFNFPKSLMNREDKYSNIFNPTLSNGSTVEIGSKPFDLIAKKDNPLLRRKSQIPVAQKSLHRSACHVKRFKRCFNKADFKSFMSLVHTTNHTAWRQARRQKTVLANDRKENIEFREGRKSRKRI